MAMVLVILSTVSGPVCGSDDITTAVRQKNTQRKTINQSPSMKESSIHTTRDKPAGQTSSMSIQHARSEEWDQTSVSQISTQHKQGEKLDEMSTPKPQTGILNKTSAGQASIQNSHNKLFAEPDKWVKAAGIIRKYVLPSTCIPGLLLNILIIVLMLKGEMKSRSVSVYYIVIAIGDIINVFAFFLSFSAVDIFGISVITIHKSVCAIVVFGMHFGAALSSGSVILLAFERMLVLRFPLRAKEFCSKKRSVIACVFMAVCAFGVHAFNLVISDIVYFGNQARCWHNPYFNDFNRNERVWLNAIFDYFMPLSLVLICNITLIRLLVTLKQKREKLVGKKEKDMMLIRKNTVTSVVICTTYILLKTPIGASTATGKLIDLTSYKPFTFILMFSVCLATIRASFNHFIVYSLTCAEFRNEVWKSFGISKLRKVLTRSSESDSFQSESEPKRYISSPTFSPTENTTSSMQ